MPFIPTEPGVARIRLVWDLDGAHAENVLYMDTGEGAPLTEAQCSFIGGMVYNGWDTTDNPNALRSVFSNACTFVSVSAEEASVNDGAYYASDIGEAGDQVLASAPPGVAWIAKWHTGFRGRNWHGRTYFPGIPEAWVSNNGSIIDPTDQLAAVEQFRLAMQATGDFADNVGLVVASFFHQVVPGTPPTVARDVAETRKITSGTVDHFVHSQRRRNLPG